MATEICTNCGSNRAKLTRGDYRFLESGLPDVTLRGIELVHCPNCGNVDPIIPRLTKIMDALAVAVARKRGPLHATEIKFLRKHTHMPPGEFATAIGVDPNVVEQWEAGAARPEPALDRLIRLVSLANSQVPQEQLGELARSLKMTEGPEGPAGIAIDPETLAYEYAA